VRPAGFDQQPGLRGAGGSGDDGRASVEVGALDEHVASVRVGRVVVGVQVVAVVPDDDQSEVAYRREHGGPRAQHDLGRASRRGEEGAVALLRGVAGLEHGERVLRQRRARGHREPFEVLGIGDDDERPAAGRQRGLAQLDQPRRPVLPRQRVPDRPRGPPLRQGGQQRRPGRVAGEARRVGRTG
jgi:hypothetical protein